jgi:hypothetical protein
MSKKLEAEILDEFKKDASKICEIAIAPNGRVFCKKHKDFMLYTYSNGNMLCQIGEDKLVSKYDMGGFLENINLIKVDNILTQIITKKCRAEWEKERDKDWVDYTVTGHSVGFMNSKEWLEFMSSKEVAPIDRVNFVKQRIEEAKEVCKEECDDKIVEETKRLLEKEDLLTKSLIQAEIRLKKAKSEIISKIKGLIENRHTDLENESVGFRVGYVHALKALLMDSKSMEVEKCIE